MLEQKSAIRQLRQHMKGRFVKGADGVGDVVSVVGEVEQAHPACALFVGELGGGIELLIGGAEEGLRSTPGGGFSSHGAMGHLGIDRHRTSCFRFGPTDAVVLVGEIAVGKVHQIDPNGGQAMSASRHPISEIGPWHMTHELNLKVHSFVDHPNMTATVSEVRGDGDRPVLKYVFSQPAPHGDLTCHQLVIYIDEALQVPLGYEVYDFAPKGSDKPVLDESYLYTKLELKPGLTQVDFDMENPAYEFKKK